MTHDLIWQPNPQQIRNNRLTEFIDHIQAHNKETFENHTPEKNTFGNYHQLHQWSVKHQDNFWNSVWDFCGVKGHKGETIYQPDEIMYQAKYFPEAQLNYAENLLYPKTEIQQPQQQKAIVFWGEDKVKLSLSWEELREQVSTLQQYYQSLGLQKGDRIAAIMPNRPETIVAMLAAASLGIIWSSCSPDFGERGILDRFSQIEPKALIACDGYWYNGKAIDLEEKLRAVSQQLPDLKKVIVVDYLETADSLENNIPLAIQWQTALQNHTPKTIHFEPLPFDHPLYILYSSGTTGVPKCIVHRQGGMLLQHLKEHQLHSNIQATQKVFYFTTCGWMMWNWLVSALASGASLMLYDGSPFYPDGNILFDYADAEDFDFFGTSAKFIDALHKGGLEPKKTHSLNKLKTLASTGSPLSPEGYRYVYQSIKKDIHLVSFSGGTDIAGCFVGGSGTLPVYIGEIQCKLLGMAVEVWNEQGQSVLEEKGELVCTQAFPSMPVYFWNDPDKEKYKSAYFSRFENIWCHGDFSEVTANKGIIIHGRSDAVLNPGGVRIGTAEIYHVVEQLPEVIESVCIGQPWQDDLRVVLFVRLAENILLDDELISRIKTKIRSGASPRHVPAKIIAVADIPRTKSGKITELAVRDTVMGREIKNTQALANPEALHFFADLQELKT